MTLYGRLTLALSFAACGGATALAATAGFGVAPTLTWAVLLGGVMACVVISARWVLRPLRRLAATLEEGPMPAADRAMEVLALRVAALQARTVEGDAQVEAQVAARLADLVDGNQALSLLFTAVSADEPGLAPEDFISRLASRWVHEGRMRAAGVVWERGGPVTVLSGGEARVGTGDVPPGLLSGADGSAPAGHPVAAVRGDLAWLAVGVPRLEGPRADRTPSALLMAWPAERPATDVERVACAAVARYLALRGRAVALDRGADTPAAEGAPHPSSTSTRTPPSG